MDKIDKALLNLTEKQRGQIYEKFSLVCLGNIKGLNIKKMKGHSDLYRLRVGNIRLIYRHNNNHEPIIIFIGKRDDQTYKDF
jgi:mRNA-degrading endonuclease RelE of RelBE toxin-antitoxin system